MHNTAAWSLWTLLAPAPLETCANLVPSASLRSYPVTLTKPSGALCFEEHDMGVQYREGEPIAGQGWLEARAGRHPRPEAMQKPASQFIVAPCSGVKVLRNTSDARRQSRELCYGFGPSTPSARSANLIAGDGTKNGFPAPNKEPAKTKKTTT